MRVHASDFPETISILRRKILVGRLDGRRNDFQMLDFIDFFFLKDDKEI
jgi:hypothetical protein